MSLVSLRYLLSFSLYLVAYFSFSGSGIWTYSLVFYVYLFIPLLEFVSKPNYSNVPIEKRDIVKNEKIYDYMVFLVVPFQYYFLFYFLSSYSFDLTLTEKIGKIISMGALCAHAINVAHDLGHRHSKFAQFLSKILLLSTLNTHFFIEHNRGHHKRVGTPEDPATALKNETVYRFIMRSMCFGYLSAWKLEFNRLKKLGLNNFSLYSFRNEMVRFTALQLAFIFGVFYFFNFHAMIAFLIVSFLGIAQLEIINYVEHYGLLRKKNEYGQYEKITKMHSWNADYVFSRLMLFELTRHSDHHIKASKKYQILSHHEKSPELPTGYIGCMLLSFVPPLWFYIMNPIVEKYQS